MKSLLSRLLAALSPSSATTTVSVSLALLICSGCETPRRATTPRPRTDREKELYERICRQPTLADCKEYNTEGFRAHRGEVFKVAESLRYHQAVAAATAEAYEAYLREFRWSAAGKDPAHVAEIERLYWLVVERSEVAADCERFKRLVTDKELAEKAAQRLAMLRAQALKVAESRRYDQAVAAATAGAYEAFLRESRWAAKGKDPAHVAEIERLYWLLVERSEVAADCERFKELVTEKELAEKAAQRLAMLRALCRVQAGKAILVADCPEVKQGGPWFKVPVSASEQGDHIGYHLDLTVQAVDSFRQPLAGTLFHGPSAVDVPPGKTRTNDYWLSNANHRLCNGIATFLWSGKDARGNAISSWQEIPLEHLDCRIHPPQPSPVLRFQALPSDKLEIRVDGMAPSLVDMVTDNSTAPPLKFFEMELTPGPHTVSLELVSGIGIPAAVNPFVNSGFPSASGGIYRNYSLSGENSLHFSAVPGRVYSFTCDFGQEQAFGSTATVPITAHLKETFRQPDSPGTTRSKEFLPVHPQ